VIHAIDHQGALIVEGQGQFVKIQPEQSWGQMITTKWNEDCQVTNRYTLYNYGLITKEQIQIVE